MANQAKSIKYEMKMKIYEEENNRESEMAKRQLRRKLMAA